MSDQHTIQTGKNKRKAMQDQLGEPEDRAGRLENDLDEEIKLDIEKQVSGQVAQEEDDQEATEQEQILKKPHASAPQELLLNQEAGRPSPESYRVNSSIETRLLAIADYFHHQYSYLYPKRKPLLLFPINECGVKKFVSTSLRPTPAVNPKLFTWEGCASFVADFLSLEPLEPPVELPRSLLSPTAVLQCQTANCFEFSTLLCSLLLSAHYDAYCVSGFGVREMCLLDQSEQDCPLLEFNGVTQEPEPQTEKLSLKQPKKIKSRFLEQDAKKKRDAEAGLQQKQNLLEEQQAADALEGLRCYCWVLVLSGSQDVQENFFIDALTGSRYATDNSSFLGIESVWNNLNYYVNMQDRSNGCSDVVFDLENLQLWEPVSGATSKRQLIVDVTKRKKKKIRTGNDEKGEELVAFEMPGSWVSPIRISEIHLESRWPGGQKATRYRKAKVERFAPYLRPDGLVTRLTRYRDPDCTEAIMLKEWYQHRSDHLEEKEISKDDGSTTERFGRGTLNLLFLKRIGTEVVMEFNNIHADEPVRRVESPGEMTEIFEGRSDFLYYRCAVYDKGAQVSDPKKRPLQRVIERFHRNKSKQANEDVAERVFQLADRRIDLTYHEDGKRPIPTTKSFSKPRVATETEKPTDFTQDMTSGLQLDLSPEPSPTQTPYGMLLDLIKEEEEVTLQITKSKMEIRDILACREKEEADMEVQFSPWTTTGAARARHQREEMELHATEEKRWLQEKKEEQLASFLIRLDNAGTLSTTNGKQFLRDCLHEFEERLLDYRRLIQRDYKKELQGLQGKQQWYQGNQLNMTKEQEDQYLTYYSEKILRIQVIKTRLSMHQQEASQLLRDLDDKLKGDPRFSSHAPQEAQPSTLINQPSSVQ